MITLTRDNVTTVQLFLACSRMDHKAISTRTQCGFFRRTFWNPLCAGTLYLTQRCCAGDCDRWSPSSYSITLSALQCPVAAIPLYLHTHWECPPPHAPTIVGCVERLAGCGGGKFNELRVSWSDNSCNTDCSAALRRVS